MQPDVIVIGRGCECVRYIYQQKIGAVMTKSVLSRYLDYIKNESGFNSYDD